MKMYLKKYHVASRSRLKWMVYISDKGDVSKKFFQTKGAAQAFIDQRQRDLENIGLRANELDADIKMEALKAYERLLPFNRRISDAVDYYIQHLHDTERSCQVDQAVEAFLAYKKEKGKSQRYLVDLKSRLKFFVAHYEKHQVAEITPKQVEDWMRVLNVVNQTKNNYRRVLNTFFEFCIKQGLCRENPIHKVEATKIVPQEVGIFSPDEMAIVLSEAKGDVLAYVAIGAFAGLRDSEIRRLSWENIRWDVKEIDLTGWMTKTAASRQVKILPVLEYFLKPFEKEKGRVCKQNFETRIREFRAQIQTPVENGRNALTWKHNALRHSCATYFYRINDAGKTAKMLGHNSTSLLFKHYNQNRVSEREAKNWFNLHKVVKN